MKQAMAQLDGRDAGTDFQITYPSIYTDPIVAEVGAQRVVLVRVGARQATAKTQNGKIFYEGAYASVDAIEIASGNRSEELLLLWDRRAPLVYDYEIVEMRGVAALEIDGGAIHFLPMLPAIPTVARVAAGGFSTPTPSLEIERPWIADVSGRQ